MMSKCHCWSRTLLGRGGSSRTLLCTRTLQDVQEHCYAQKRYEMYENATIYLRTLLCCYVRERFEFNNDLSEGSSVINNTRTMTIWVKGRRLSTTRTVSSTLQATSAHGAHRRVIIFNTWWLLAIWHDNDLCGKPLNQRLDDLCDQ